MFTPSTSISPCCTSNSRQIRLAVVLLPAPLLPTRPIISPGLTSRLTFLSTGVVRILDIRIAVQNFEDPLRRGERPRQVVPYAAQELERTVEHPEVRQERHHGPERHVSTDHLT